jgi:N-acetylneuraminic acid mutarotase
VKESFWQLYQYISAILLTSPIGKFSLGKLLPRKNDLLFIHMPIQKKILLILLLAYNSICNSQSNEWTWVSGDNITGQHGVYGSKGISNAGNKPGGRIGYMNWIDNNGNLWMFGGAGYAASGIQGYLNDLWKFDQLSSEWIWISGDSTINQFGIYGIKGTAEMNNRPGARYNGTQWFDGEGRLWLFGGWGQSENNRARLNDLWMFDPKTGKWTWENGDKIVESMGVYGIKGIASYSNKPGARTDALSWVDSNGTMWLFGGNGYGTTGMNSYLNDLWRYNPATNQWTWVSGDNSTNQYSHYGVKGVPSASNKPGARTGSATWADNNGNLWLFGGSGYAATSSPWLLNDLWQYNPTTNQWAWVSGDQVTSQNGIYGNKGIPNTLNKPGARGSAASWIDDNGNLWLLGGGGYTATSFGLLTDLWKYETSTNNWVWMSGDQTPNEYGIYGSKNVSNTWNKPGARSDAKAWRDKGKNIWLLGGNIYKGEGGVWSDGGNDLWKYGVSKGISINQLSSNKFCPNDKFNLSFNANGDYDTGNTFAVLLSDNTGGFSSPDTIGKINASVSGDYTISATIPSKASGYGFKIRVISNKPQIVENYINTITISEFPPTPVISVNGSTSFCEGDSVTLHSSATSNNQWLRNNIPIVGATGPQYVSSSSGNYSLIVSNNGCNETSATTFVIAKKFPDKPIITQKDNTLISSANTGNQWYWNGALITGATEKQLSLQATGLYTVQATENGCSTRSDAHNYTYTGSLLRNGEVLVFPNPVEDKLSITNLASRVLKVRLFDALGRVIYTNQFSDLSAKIQTKSLKNGVYLLLVTDLNNNETLMKKIIKQ